MYVRYLVIFLSLIIHYSCSSQQISFKEQLEQLPGVVSVAEIVTDSLFLEQYDVYFEQEIDHTSKEAGTFQQRVIVSHVNNKAPVVAVLEGYSISHARATEITQYFNCNQINIEHRFFKNSRPDTIPWEKLTVWQAATDQHKIIQALKTIYSNSWLTTGVSKGGQTTMFHRCYYPNDVSASVPYVAPLNLAREDERIYEFLKSVGEEEDRMRVYNFQLLCFKNFNELLLKFKTKAKEKKWTFAMGLERALEYTILEYSFALWQYGGIKFENIPDSTATVSQLFNHLATISSFTFFEDSGVSEYHPFFWAALTEIGMYGYQTKPFEEYLGDTIYTFDFTAPPGTKPKYTSKTVNEVKSFLDTEASNMLFIVGAYDTWGATAYYPSGNNNLLTKVLEKGYHGTSINDFKSNERMQMYSLLQEWLNVKTIGEYE